MQDAVHPHSTADATRELRDRQDARELDILDKLIATYPGREDLLISRAYCLDRLGRHAEAEALHRRIAQTSSSERVQKLGLFISKRSGPVFAADPAPRAPSATETTLAAPLAKKLDIVRKSFEHEIEAFREQREESATIVQRLQTRLADRERAVQALSSKNEELESLLSSLGTELTALNAPASVPELGGDAQRSMDEIHARLETAERELRERDETLSSLFRKNGDQERVIRRLNSELDELHSEASGVSATEDELRRELQKAREEAIEARRSAADVQGLRGSLRSAEENVQTIEAEREAVRARIASLEQRLTETLSRESRALDINRALQEQADDQAEQLKRAGEALGAIDAHFSSTGASPSRRPGLSPLAETAEHLALEMTGLRAALAAVTAERVSLAQFLAALQAEYDALQTEYDALLEQRIALQAELAVHREEIELSHLRRAELDQALVAADVRMTVIDVREKELESRVQTLTRRLGERDTELREAKLNAARIEAELDSARRDRYSLTQRENELLADSETLAAGLMKERAAQQELLSAKDRLERVIAEMRVDLSGMTEAAGIAREEAVMQREAREILAVEHAGVERRLGRSLEESKRAAMERDALQDALLAIETREQDLAGRWADTDARLREAMAALDARERDFASLSGERRELGARLAELQAKMDVLLKSGSEQAQEITRLGRELEERKAAYVHVDEQRAQSELSLSHLKIEHAHLAKHERKAREEIEALVQDLHRRESQIEELNAERSRLLAEQTALGVRIDSLEQSDRKSRDTTESLAQELGSARESLDRAAETRRELEAEVARRQEYLARAVERESAAAIQAQELLAEIEVQAGRISELEAGRVALLSEKGQSESQALELQERYQRASEEISSLTISLHRAERELAELRIQRAQLEAEEDRLLVEIGALRAQEEQARRRGDRLDGEVLDRDRRIAGLENEVALRDESIAGIAGELRDREERIHELDIEKLALKDRGERLDGEVLDRDRRIAGLENEVALRDDSISGISRELSVREDRIREIELEKFTMKERVDTLELEIPPLKEKEISLETRVAALDAELSAERDVRTQTAGELATAQRRVEDMLAMVTTLEGELTRAGHVHEELEAARVSVEADLAQTRTEREAAEARIRELQDRIAMIEANLADMTVSAQQTASRATQLEGALHERDTVIEEARVQLQHSRDMIHRLQPELDRVYTQELPEALEQKVSALRRLQDLRSEIELLRSQLW